MADFSQKHEINICPGISAPLVIHCSQGDVGTPIYLTVYNGSVEADLSGVKNPEVHGVREDRVQWGPFPVTINGSVVSFTLQSVMTAIDGSGIGEIRFGSIGTANFCLLVEQGTFPNRVTYENDVSVYYSILTYLQSKLSGVDTAVSIAKNAAANAAEEAKKAVPSAVADWLSKNTTAGAGTVDKTLKISGAAADSKTVGDKLTVLEKAAKDHEALKGMDQYLNRAVDKLQESDKSQNVTITDINYWLSEIKKQFQFYNEPLLDENGRALTNEEGKALYVTRYGVVTDKSLTLYNVPADAGTVGARFTALERKQGLNDATDVYMHRAIDALQAADISHDTSIKSINDWLNYAKSLFTYYNEPLLDDSGRLLRDEKNNPLFVTRYGVVTDKSLSLKDTPADSGAVGDKFREFEKQAIIDDAYDQYQNLKIEDLKNKQNDLKNLVDELENWLDRIKRSFQIREFALTDEWNRALTDKISKKALLATEYGIKTDSTMTQLGVPADAKGVNDWFFKPENNTYLYGWSGNRNIGWPGWTAQTQIPILYVWGDLPWSKDQGSFKIEYKLVNLPGVDNMEGKGKVKVQGQSSAGFPKHNYNFTFADKFVAREGWPMTKKYTFKGWYNDFTYARNIVSARLWTSMMKSKSNISQSYLCYDKNTKLEDGSDGSGQMIQVSDTNVLQLPTYPIDMLDRRGVTDGFPIYVVQNGRYIGIYTMMIKKGDDMFGMDMKNLYSKTECVISNEGAGTGGAGGFKSANAIIDAEKGEDVSGKSTAWTYEWIPHEKPDPDDYDNGEDDEDYKSDLKKYEKDNTACRASFNNMIQSVVDSTGTSDKATYYEKVSGQYLDYNSVVDYMIFTALIEALDCVGKNWLVYTYDGTKWAFSPYDLDCTWGNYQDAALEIAPNGSSPKISTWNGANRAMHMIYQYDPQRLINRYRYLRQTTFSEYNVYMEFLQFMRRIPLNARLMETHLYPSTGSASEMSFAQIMEWYRLRCKFIDEEIDALDARVNGTNQTT